MKERIIGFVKTYILLVCVFVMQKPLFMLFYYALYDGCKWLDWLEVIWYGLPLDLSLAGYLTVIPGMLYVVSVWTLSRTLHRLWCGYFLLISFLASLIFVVDISLYKPCASHLDIPALFHLFLSPRDMLAELSLWNIALGFVSILVYAALLYGLFYALMLKRASLLHMKLPYQRLTVSGILFLVIGILVIPIRGGFNTSALHTKAIHFSTDQCLNDAAINPAFRLLETLWEDQGSDNRYYDEGNGTSDISGETV